MSDVLPAVSIAIPTFNRGRILVETLTRLLTIQPGPAEIIVVDQTPEHPADVSAKIEELVASGAISLVRLDRPSIPHAMNVALLRAASPVVLFVDDDVDAPASLVEAHARAHTTRGVWAVVGQVFQPGESQKHYGEAELRRGMLQDLEFRFNHDQPCDVASTIACNLSVKRDETIALGGFDENFVGAAHRFETDFARRVASAGGRVRFEPSASLRHLKLATGGLRSYGNHLAAASPAHSVGDYYFALHHAPSFWAYVASRMRRNVATRYHASHPWTIPTKVLGEVRGMLLARSLFQGGRRLMTDSGWHE